MRQQSTARRGGFTQLAPVVQRVLKDLGKPEKRREAYLIEVWPRLAPPSLSQLIRPKRLFGKTLYFHVGDAVSAHELTVTHRRRVLELYQAEVGRDQITDVRFTPGAARSSQCL